MSEEKKKLLTPKGRISYPKLFEMDTFGNTPQFRVSLLIPKELSGKDEEKFNAMADAIEAAWKAKWGGKKPKNFKSPISDGDAEDEDNEAAQGCWIVKFGTTNKNFGPPVMANPKIEATPDDIKAGDYGRAQYFAHAYDVDDGKSRGVKLILENFQWLAEGEPLGSVSDNPEEAFDDDESSDETPEPAAKSSGAAKFL